MNEDYERRKLAEQKEAERIAAEKAADAAVVAACEAAHNTQCNKGADFIKKREEELANFQYMDKQRRWLDSGKVGPPPRRPPLPEPRVVDTKKK